MKNNLTNLTSVEDATWAREERSDESVSLSISRSTYKP